MQRILRIACGCGSELALLIGEPDQFDDELRVAKAAIGSSRPWRDVSGRLECAKCGQVIEVVRQARREK